MPAEGQSVQCLSAGRLEAGVPESGLCVWSLETNRTVLTGATMRLPLPWTCGIGAEEACERCIW